MTNRFLAVFFLLACAPFSDLAAQILYTAPAISTSTLPEGVGLSTTAVSGHEEAEEREEETGQERKPKPPLEFAPSPIPLSGMVLMPTAYRGNGRNTLGLGLDFNAAYYIGRLYGKNTLDWTMQKTNYMDRVGIWLLTADAKMTVQTETAWRPALAAGVQGTYSLRDAPSPTLNPTAAPTLTVSVNRTNALGAAYLVLTKRLHRKFITSAGYMEGNAVDQISHLSEFLSKDALRFSGYPETGATSRNMLFAGFIWLPSPTYPISAEILIPQGAPAGPKLINLHLGRLLKLNFELSLLTFKGGWDLLGMFQFRYSYFPK